MKRFETGADLAREFGVPVSNLDSCFTAYNEVARTKNDPYGKKFFANTPFSTSDYFYVAVITPVIHYCMGGITIGNGGEVLLKNGASVPVCLFLS